jgi:hypothetical protein
VFDQEALGALHTPFGKASIVFRGTSPVGMAFQRQVGILLTLEIFIEIFRKRYKGLLLAGKQSTLRFCDRRLIGRKINAVQAEPGFQSSRL